MIYFLKNFKIVDISKRKFPDEENCYFPKIDSENLQSCNQIFNFAPPPPDNAHYAHTDPSHTTTDPRK